MLCVQARAAAAPQIMLVNASLRSKDTGFHRFSDSLARKRKSGSNDNGIAELSHVACPYVAHGFLLLFLFISALSHPGIATSRIPGISATGTGTG